MPCLLELPLELLTLIASHLELPDLFRFCSACLRLRQSFKPDKLIWLLKNYATGTPDTAPAIRDCSHLLLCHTFVELFRCRGLRCDYRPLLRRGASLAHIPHGKVISDTFDQTGPSRRFQFLIRHGGSLESGPGGINQLLERTIQCHPELKRVDFLFARGATFTAVPSGLETLLEELVKRPDCHSTLNFILIRIDKLRYTPPALAERLLMLYEQQSFGPDTNIILAALPDGLELLLEKVLLSDGLGTRANQLMQRGASLQQLAQSAAAQGNTELLQLLYVSGADINDSNSDGLTPVHLAASNGEVSVVKFLLGRGANPNLSNERGWTPLLSAASYGHSEIVEALLDGGADHAVASQDGWMPLLAAASEGHIECTSLLVAKRGPLDAVNSGGWTALNAASSKGYVDVVRILLNAGADLSITQQGGQSPFLSAVSMGHIEIAKLLLDYGASLFGTDDVGWTCLHAAASANECETIGFLLKQGADVSSRDYKGRSALYQAASNGHLQAVRTLAGLGADMNTATTDLERTPMYTAACNGSIDIVKFLWNEGALLTPTVDGWTPNMAAAINGHLQVMKFFRSKGVPLDEMNSEGSTVLDIAALRGRYNVVEWLLEDQRIDPRQTEHIKFPPLYSAAQGGHFQVFQLLLDHGANIKVPTKYGFRPLDAALTSGNQELIEFLRIHGDKSTHYVGRLARSLYRLARGSLSDRSISKADKFPREVGKMEISDRAL